MIEYQDMSTEAEELFTAVDGYLSTQERHQVEAAYELARQAHGDQRRQTGEPFYLHPVTVASYLAEYRLDAAAVVAALLHDLAEDTLVSLEEIEDQFGSEVAALVDSVTKLKEVTRGVASDVVAQGRTLSGKELQHATLRKLFQAMTVDVRAVIIKLFDRLHNMRTIHGMPPHKRVEKAQETLSVFAPLANRLGMWDLKSELEALSLAVIDPHACNTIGRELARLHEAQRPLFEVVREEILDCLHEAGLHPRMVKLAPENIYTVYTDLSRQKVGYREIDRMMRVVVLFDDVYDCYTALGHLHHLWNAVPQRVDDYISVRRDNLYQSLHTTVVHTNGQPMKIRLRTVDMDTVAQMGVLAKWLYAGTPLWSPGLAERLDDLFNSINSSISVEPQNPTVAVQSVVEDVFRAQIRVYTPEGDPIDLAEGATPIDFAYKIHTELGHECHAAYVNDLLFPLNKPLHNGQQVRIIKSPRAKPERAWLDEDLGYITTTYARTHARRWFRRLPRAEAVRQGKEIVVHELEMLGLTDLDHLEVAKAFGYEDTTELYHHLGRAELLPTAFATGVMTDHWADGPCLPLDSVVTAPDGTKYIITNADNRRLRICATCDPRPRDAILGYVRKDGLITVHREGCHTLNATRYRPDVIHRKLKLGWGDEAPREARLIAVRVDVFDRPGLLFEITQLMEEKQVNIPHICTYPSTRKGELQIVLGLEVTSPRQMVRILHRTEALVNVISVRRMPDEQGAEAVDRQLQPPPTYSTRPFYKPE